MFPLSNWTELDVWQYIALERHSDCSAVFRERARDDRARRRADSAGARSSAAAGREAADGACAGCDRSDARPAPARFDPTRIRCEKIIEELFLVRRSERENRVIDHDTEGSMEIKKREGYF